MNPYGSYRALLGNSISAMCAAIEVYNKPRIEYREETAIILLVNAWELLLKAVLSKNRIRIYYPKKRGQPYRTLSVSDALKAAEPCFPKSIDYLPASENLRLLVEYRDRTVHFYNKPGLETVLYTLAQTSIVNYRDIIREVFGRDLADEVTLSLLPLGFSPPVEPVEFLRDTPEDPAASQQLRDFIKEIVHTVGVVESEGRDTGRLLTVFKVNLQSVKKIESADLVVGVEPKAKGSAAQLLIQRTADPNKTHPFRESDIITSKSHPKRKGKEIEYDGRPLGQYEFRAIGHKYKVKQEPKWCWQDETGAVTRYSPGYVQFLTSLDADAVREAVREYRTR